SPCQALHRLGDADRVTRIVVDHGTPRVVARVEPGDPEGFPGREQLGVLELEILRRHGRYSGHGGASFEGGYLAPGPGPGRGVSYRPGYQPRNWPCRVQKAASAAMTARPVPAARRRRAGRPADQRRPRVATCRASLAAL